MKINSLSVHRQRTITARLCNQLHVYVVWTVAPHELYNMQCPLSHVEAAVLLMTL